MKMSSVAAALTVGACFLVVAVACAAAANCVTDGCHATILAPKYLHGPVAAEEAGVEGCLSCHRPAGAACTAAKAGQYKFKTKKNRLCLMCHDRGTGTQHTKAGSRCLSCHSPHGSETSTKMMRAG